MSEFFSGKKPLSAAEFDEFVKKLTASYESKLADQKERIFSLVDENKKLSGLVFEYRQKDAQISQALMMAAAKAKETERLSQKRYDMEMERLKVFHSKWISYYTDIKSKFSFDESLLSAETFLSEMDRILGFDSPVFKRAQMQAAAQYISESKRLNLNPHKAEDIAKQYDKYLSGEDKTSDMDTAAVISQVGTGGKSGAQHAMSGGDNALYKNLQDMSEQGGNGDTAKGKTYTPKDNSASPNTLRGLKDFAKNDAQGNTKNIGGANKSFASGNSGSDALASLDTDIKLSEELGLFPDADFYNYIKSETFAPAGNHPGYDMHDNAFDKTKTDKNLAGGLSKESYNTNAVKKDNSQTAEIDGIDLNQVLAPKDLPSLEELIKQMQILNK